MGGGGKMEINGDDASWLLQHGAGCGCWDCVVTLQTEIFNMMRERRDAYQAELKGRIMTDQVNLPTQIKAVEREIALRERVYPRQVAMGNMDQFEAEMHIVEMRAVLKTLTWLETNRELIVKAAAGAKTNGLHGPSKANGVGEGIRNPSPDVSGDGGEEVDNAGRG
jgi:hypothetical protein